MRNGELRLLANVAVFFAVAWILYPLLPELMASHWNAEGVVDGYIPKFWGVFLIPFVALAIALLFNFFGKADPLKKNIDTFISYYDNLVNLILLFLFYIYLLTLAWNFGFRFNMIMMLVPAFSILIYFLGVVTEHTKRNYTVGIRTPWTLHSDVVWDKTHKVGGMLFKIAAIICLNGIFFEKYAIFFLLIPLLIAVFISFFYSYYAFKKCKVK